MAGSREESWSVGLRTPQAPWSLLILVLFSLACAVLAFGPGPSLPALPGVPEGSFWTALLLFLVPALPGTAVASPIAAALGGKLNLKRALFTGVPMFGLLALGLVLWRVFTLVHGAYPVEGVLLALFGITVWLRQMLVSGISGPTPGRAVPAAMVAPVVGVFMVWGLLGISLTLILEGVFFLLLPLGAVTLLIRAADRPMRKEFGEGGVTILRPLIDHINERDPAASRKMEEFFSTSPSEADLAVSVLRFQGAKGTELLWVLPTVHPGPFAELGASDLPHKMAGMLAGTAREIAVPHAPCTHDQNIPTTEEVRRVAEEVRKFLPGLVSSPSRASPLVSPHPGSMVRAQALGETVLLLISSAPAASDDIDYSVGEMLREEARRQGYRDALVIDAHNSYVGENMGTVPFGSPASFKLVSDARAALEAAARAVRETPVRMGFSRKQGYTPQADGIGREGLAVTVIEADGKRTAYALIDGNNLLTGFREKLVAVLKKSADEAEVMTTDNHVVHEVANGLNPVGKLRTVEELSADLDLLVKEAVVRLAPVEVASGETRVRGVKVMGHAMTVRLMTSLNASFSAFWIMLPTTFLLTVSGTLLVLVLFP